MSTTVPGLNLVLTLIFLPHVFLFIFLFPAFDFESSSLKNLFLLQSAVAGRGRRGWQKAAADLAWWCLTLMEDLDRSLGDMLDFIPCVFITSCPGRLFLSFSNLCCGG